MGGRLASAGHTSRQLLPTGAAFFGVWLVPRRVPPVYRAFRRAAGRPPPALGGGLGTDTRGSGAQEKSGWSDPVRFALGKFDWVAGLVGRVGFGSSSPTLRTLELSSPVTLIGYRESLERETGSCKSYILDI